MLLVLLTMHQRARLQCDSREARGVPFASNNGMAQILPFAGFVPEFVRKLIGAVAQCSINFAAPAGIE